MVQKYRRNIRARVIALARNAPPSFAGVPPARTRGSGAPTGARVLARHPSRASDAGPQAHKCDAPRVPRGPACAVRASGDARLSALHLGDFLAPAVLPGASRALLTRQRAGRRSRPAHAVATSTQAGGTTRRIVLDRGLSNESGAVNRTAVCSLFTGSTCAEKLSSAISCWRRERCPRRPTVAARHSESDCTCYLLNRFGWVAA